MKLFSIQEVANLLGVSTKTLRRWEEKGILVPQRTPGNQRRYTQEQVDNFRQERGGSESSQPTPKSSSQQYWTEELVKSILTFKRLAVSAVFVMLFVAVAAVAIATLKSANLLDIASLPKILSVLGISKDNLQAPELSEVLRTGGKAVLGAGTSAENLIFGVKVQSEFADSAQFLNTIKVGGIATLSGGVITEDQDVNAGTGRLTASNVLYGAIAGEGIAVGPGQTPTITNTAVLSLTAGSGISVGTGSKPTVTNTGVLSLGGNTGALDLKAGTGISVSGLTITNSALTFKTIAVTGSNTITAASLTDTLTFEAGTGIALSSNSTTKAITIAGAATSASWQENANALSPFNIGDDVLIGGISTATAKFGFINVSSGTPVATISANSGNNAAFLTGAGVLGTTNAKTLTIGNSSTGEVVISPSGTTALTARGTNLIGAGTLTGLTGLTSSGTITFSAFTSNGGPLYTNGSGVLAQTTAGTTSQCLLGGTTPSFGSCGTGVTTDIFWNQSSGLLFPNNSTVDFAIGGQASTSAKFAILNINSGTPVASVSAQNAAASALVLGSDSTIQSVKMQTLTLGGSTTGNITLSPLSGSGTVTNTGNLNLLNGKEYQIAGSSVLTASTLGGGVTTSSLTSVGTITTGAWQGTAVGVGFGGTGQTSYTDGQLLIGNTTGNTLTKSTLTAGTGISITNGSGSITIANSQGSIDSFWNQSSGLLFPNNSTVDFAIGGQSSTSAKFAVLNINSGTPTASISANSGNNATVLTGLGVLSTVNGQTLTLGDTNTGNIVLTSANASSYTIGAAGTTGTITLGSSSGTNSVLIANGAGATTLNLANVQVGGAVNIGAGMTTGTIAIGGTGLQTGTITFGGGTGAQTVNLGTGGTGIKTVNLATGTAANVIAIGGGAGTLAIDTGDWDIGTTGNATGLGNITADGTITFSTFTSNGGPLYTNGSGVLAQTTAGTTSQCLLGGTTPSFGSCGTGVTTDIFWNQSSGLLFPNNSTVDFAIGGQASTSAKFAILNINSGTPVASVSATATGTGLALSGGGSIQSLLNTTLTIGGGTTGNIVLTPNNGTGGLVTANSNLNLSTGNAFQIAGLSVLTGLTLGDGVTQSSLTKVGTITTGTWTASIIGSTYGGTGANLGSSAQGTVPYFSSTGVMSALAVGSAGQCLTTNGAAANPSWATCALGSGTNWWNQTSGVLYPVNSTLDLLLGATATASAKFAVLNINSGTPTASVSAGTAGGTYLSATGTLSTTAMQTLTLGGSTTGNVVIDSGSSSITLSDNTNLANNLLLNIGTAVTDFSSTGGLTLDDTLTISIPVANGIDINTSGTITTGVNVNGTPTGFFGAATITTGYKYALTAALSATNTGTDAYLISLLNSGSGDSTTLTNGFHLLADAAAGGVMTVTNGLLIEAIGTATITNDIKLQKSALINNATAGTVTLTSGTTGGGAALAVNQNGATTNDIFTASASGAPKFTISNGGNIVSVAGAKWQPLTNSATALQIANAAGTAFVNFDTTRSRIGIGTQTAPIGLLDIAGDAGNNATLILNNTGATTSDIFTASASGTTKFTIQNGGTASSAGNFVFDSAASIQTTKNQTLTIGGNTTGDIQFKPGNSSTSLYLTSGGNVGIGTTTPGSIAGFTTVGAVGTSSDNGGIFESVGFNGTTKTRFYASGGTGYVGTVSNHPLGLFTNNAVKMTIDASGNVGIGTTTPNSLLQVAGTASVAGAFTIYTTPTIQSTTNQTLTIGGNTTGELILKQSNLNLLIAPGGVASGNLFVGLQAGDSNTTGGSNTALGTQALQFNIISNNNTAVGYQALNSTGVFGVIGNNNTAVGYQALFSNTTGSSNTALGYQAGYAGGGTTSFTNTTGSNNIFIGYNSGPFSATQRNNMTAIGAFSVVDQANSLVLGGLSTSAYAVNVGIGTATPSATLDIQGGNMGGRSVLIVNQTGASANDIFTASASGITKLVLNNAGRLGLGQTTVKGLLDITGSAGQNAAFILNNTGTNANDYLFTASSSGITKFVINNIGRIGVGTTTSPIGLLQVSGDAGNNATLILNNTGATTSDLITASASGTTKFRIANNGDAVLSAGITLGATNGTSAQCLLGGATAAWGSCAAGAGSNWDVVNGVITPKLTSTLDFLLGSQASASAKFAVLNIDSGTPTASISAASAAIGSRTGLVLGADSTIQSLQKLNLTIGGSTTGGINFTPGNIQTAFLSSIGRVGIGTTTNPIGLLQVAGDAGNNAALIVNQTGASTADIFTASASGTTRFVLTNSGGVGINTGANNSTLLGTLDVRPNLTNGGTISVASISGKTSFAGLLVDNSGVGDIFTASASGATRLRMANDGSVVFAGNILTSIGNGGSGTGSDAVVNAIGDQDSMIPNASFESNYGLKPPGAGQQYFADGWVTDATSSATTTFTRDTLVFAHGDASAKVVINNGSGAFYSACVPISSVTANNYNLTFYARAIAPIPTVRAYLDQYTSKASCQSDTSPTVLLVSSPAVTTSWAKYGPSTLSVNSGNYWGRIHFFIACDAGVLPCASSTVNIDGVIFSRVYNAGGLDYAENYPADPFHIPEAGDVVSLTSINGAAQVAPSEKYMDQGTIGVVSTEPGYLLGDSVADPKAPVALAGRVPVKVSSKNGEIHIGDYLASSDIPGVAVRAITAGPVIGTAMENYTASNAAAADSDPTRVGKIVMFIKNTYIPFAPMSIAADGNLSSFSSSVSSEAAAMALGLSGVPKEPEAPTINNQQSTINSASNAASFDLASDTKFIDLKSRVASVEAKVAFDATQIEDLRSQIINSSTQSAFLASITSQPAVFGASDSAQFMTDIQNATISGDLNVLGRTTVTDLGVTGNIATGLLSIHGLDSSLNPSAGSGQVGAATINSIGDLYFQNNGLGGINILAGKVTIDTQGNIKTAGEITAKKINIDTSESNSPSLGSATLLAGETNIDITTTAVTNKSKIFVTATSKTGGQALLVTQKTAGLGFTVQIEISYIQDIKFDWWIVDER